MTSPSVTSELYGPVRHDVGKVDELIASLKPEDFPFLARVLDHLLEAGGKRIRPAIALLCGRMGDYRLDLLVPLAASIELLHSGHAVPRRRDRRRPDEAWPADGEFARGQRCLRDGR
jgi:hypothetical protein